VLIPLTAAVALKCQFLPICPHDDQAPVTITFSAINGNGLIDNNVRTYRREGTGYRLWDTTAVGFWSNYDKVTFLVSKLLLATLTHNYTCTGNRHFL
jgi:hypothetical protein